MSGNIVKGVTFEDSGVSLMGRILGGDATAIQQADITSISYAVFTVAIVDGVEEGTPVSGGTGSLTVSTVVFNALQTDDRWSVDEEGYNFRWDTPASLLATGNTLHRFEVKFTPSSGEAFFAVWDVYAKNVYTS